MTAPVLADGEPYHGAVAVMDESAHEAGAGIYYNLTVVRIPETAAVLPALSQVIGNRPFHSSEEGPEAIERMATKWAVTSLPTASQSASSASRASSARDRFSGQQRSVLAVSSESPVSAYVFGTEQHRAATPVLPIVQQDSTGRRK